VLNLSDPQAHSWRQGSIVPRQILKSIPWMPDLASPLMPGDLVVITSHSCDVCCGQSAEEPYIEVIPARHIPEGRLDGNYTDGKSPRHLHLFIQTNERQAYQLSIAERRLLPRALFEQNLCDCSNISRSEMPVFRRWLRRRYDRTVLPTAFNLRVRRAEEALRQKLKTKGHLVSRVLVSVDPEREIGEDENYRLLVVLVVRAPQAEESRKALVDVREKLTVAFTKCKGVELLDFDILSEAELTLEDVGALTRWDYSDHLSSAEDTNGLE
jgi:hypothetical protein